MTVKHVPPDSAEYLAGPMPKYAEGTFTVKGKKVDANALKPIDDAEEEPNGDSGPS